MLNAFDPNYLRLLVEEGQEETKHKLGAMSTQVEKYHGPFWDDAGTMAGGDQYSPENTYFEYMSAMVPRLVAHNPRVRVSSRRVGPQEDVAEAIRHGLNRIIRDQRLNVQLRGLAVDMLFNWGVALVKETPREGVILAEDDPIGTANPTWPVVERVPQNKFFMDPEAYDWESTRFRGHEWRMDRDDLLQRAKDHPDEKWDVEEIEALSTDIKEHDNYDHGNTSSNRRGTKVARKEIRAYDIWIPEIELSDSPGKDQGFYGTIFCIAIAQANRTGEVYSEADDEMAEETKAGFIREPRPFFGPRTGPYTLFGCYRVPDSPFPLSPLVAVEGQILDLNDHVAAANRSMSRHKRLIAVADNSTAQKVKNQLHDYVITVPFDQGKAQVTEVEMAGHTEKQLEHIQITKDRVDRVLGMDEVMRGSAQGGVTATATTLATESAMARLSEIKESFVTATTDLLESLAHYMYYSDTIVFPLGEEVFEEQDIQIPDFPGLEVQPWFRGGDHDPKSGHTFYDLELEIEAYSMERTSEGLAQQRALQTHELLMGSMELWERFPDYPWKEHFKKIGDAMNMPNLEEFITKDMLDRLVKQQEMMTQLQANPQMAAPQGPRVSKQVGGGGSQASQGQGPATAARSQGGGMPGQKQGPQNKKAVGA
jgi:hypothetical protein